MAFWNSKYRNGSEKALRTAAQLVAGSAVGRSAGFNIGSSSSSFSNGSSDIDDATRLLLRARADAFYRGQTGELKAVIDNSFAAADETRRGRVTLPEVLKGVAPLCIEAGDQDVIVKLFRFLSASPNPNSEPLLSFPDFLVISYVFACGIRLCNSCSLPVLPMLGYSCRACLELASGTFDLCLPCYSSRRFPAHLHDPSSFVDHGILYNALTLNKLANTNKLTNTNAATVTGLQPDQELRLAQLRMESQQVRMLASTMANFGQTISDLVTPGSTHYTYTYF